MAQPSAARRFALLYWLLYFPVLAFDDLPGFAWLLAAYNAVWAALLPPLGHVVAPSLPFSDTTELRVDSSYGYTHVVAGIVLALAGSAIWSFLERGRPSSGAGARLDRAEEVVRVVVRYGLANAMFHYGAAKVLSTQFPAPEPDRLLEPLSEWSRQTLLWTFMGASPLYTFATGAVECAGGVLVLWRRTTTLGAVVVAGAMANVVLLNLAYDVPIKIHSTHLLLMAVFLGWPDAGKLARVLVLHRPTAAASFEPHFSTARGRRLGLIAKWAFVVFFLGSEAAGAVATWREDGSDAPRPALYGIWRVDALARSGVDSSGDAGPPSPWKRLTVSRSGAPNEGRVTIWRADEGRDGYALQTDEAKGSLVLRPRGKGAPLSFSYERPDPDHLVLTGRLDGAETRIALHRVPQDRSKLARPMRWIRENVFAD